MDFYDEDLPEIKPTLVESWRKSKDVVVYAGKFVGIPTGLFALTCIANYFIDKKIGSL